MDKAEIQGLVSKLENDKARHEEKCGDTPRHDSKLANIAETVRDLELQISDDTARNTNAVEDRNGCVSSGDLTVRGDELDKVVRLQDAAITLEERNKGEQAQAVKKQMRGMVAKELNELDGFDR